MAKEIQLARTRQPVMTPQLPERLKPWIEPSAAVDPLTGRVPRSWIWPASIPADVSAMLPAALSSHEAATEPATREFIVTHLARLAAHYPIVRSEAQWSFVFEDFASDMRDIPADILLRVIRDHRQRSRFFPCVAELLEPAELLLRLRYHDVKRIRQLMLVEVEK